MSDTKLGTLLDTDAQRDAIHIAIAPVVAGEPLDPGMHVDLDDKGRAVESTTPIGIVDPFLTRPVKTGERFYLCLYQQTVTGMRHHWSHPAFLPIDERVVVAGDKASASRQWLLGYADSINRTVDYVIEQAEAGDYIVADGVDQHNYEYDGDVEEFWRHIENVVGHPISDSIKSHNIFSCSC